MKKYLISKGSLAGNISIPSSKSHTLRAILFASLAHGTSTIRHYLPSSDTQAMINACQLLGATVNTSPTQLSIQGTGGTIRHAEDVINAGNSGIVLRFCSAIGALSHHPVVVTGDYSIRHQRPIQPLILGLRQLGAAAISMRGDEYAPVIIQGPLQPGKATIFGADSQPVSALLIASAFVKGAVEIDVTSPGEKPWVALTLDWFDRLGISYVNDSFEHYRLQGHAHYEGFEYAVPGDFSSAAFPLAAALITQSELTIHNIDMEDSQGDKEIITVFQKMGARIDIDRPQRCLHVRKTPSLHGIAVDINSFIDAITILAVVACFADGETHIYNGAIAKKKECDRIACIAAELRKMGGDITETADGLIIRKSPLQGAQLDSHNDHRMAMSLAVAALGAKGKTSINSVECISKTFPSFAQDFISLGAPIKPL